MGLESLRNKFGLRCCVDVGPVAVYRCRELTEATPEDVEMLRALGIATVFDLRKRAERETAPEPELITSAFEVRACTVDLQGDEDRTRATVDPCVKRAYGEPGERMRVLYRIMAGHGSTVREVVHDISAAPHPVLVHCANGKDRVGVVCASLQRFRGVSPEVILEDYLVTNEYNEAINRRDLRRYAGIVQPDELEVLSAMFEAREAYLHEFFSAIDEYYGSFDTWMAG